MYDCFVRFLLFFFKSINCFLLLKLVFMSVVIFFGLSVSKCIVIKSLLFGCLVRCTKNFVLSFSFVKLRDSSYVKWSGSLFIMSGFVFMVVWIILVKFIVVLLCGFCGKMKLYCCNSLAFRSGSYVLNIFSFFFILCMVIICKYLFFWLWCSCIEVLYGGVWLSMF